MNCLKLFKIRDQLGSVYLCACKYFTESEKYKAHAFPLGKSTGYIFCSTNVITPDSFWVTCAEEHKATHIALHCFYTEKARLRWPALLINVTGDRVIIDAFYIENLIEIL